MPRSLFDSLNHFIQKRYRWVIIAWVVAVLLSLVLIPAFFSSVSYDLTGGFGGPPNAEAEKASAIVNAQFPSSNASDNSILIVVQNSQVYSDQLKQAALALNNTLYKDPAVENYTGETSLYSLEANLLNESLPSIINQTESLQSTIAAINSGLYTLQDNLSTLSSNLFQLQDGINQTAQLVYGIPSNFVGAWQQTETQMPDPIMASTYTNSIFNVTSNFGGNIQAQAYYSSFYTAWITSFSTLANSTSASDREAYAIGQAVATLISSPQLDSQTSQMFGLVSSGLTLSTWNQADALENLTISSIASSIPASLSTSLGASPTSLVDEIYCLEPSPSNVTLGNYAVTLLETSYSNMTSSNEGFSLADLIQSTYQLGSSPTNDQNYNLACDLIANATQNTFIDSPLFSINSSALSNLLSTFNNDPTTAGINSAITNLILTQSVANYPYVPTTALSDNFVNSQNNTMLIILGFKSNPANSVITQVQNDVKNSALQNEGTVYVTGGSVLTKDIANVFLPALAITVGPGVAISLLIVGLLFLAPLAALIPVLLGGVSISVALASIYALVVKIGHGNLTFLTPTLTILLMLGLAVDYSVLQLRRTREERQKGKSIQESVGVSIKCAGQAVLTAGITVIVAYIVMAVANVPIFSDVGTAIALGVAILLAASLTLLPAFEIALGDKIFWPGLNRLSKAKADPKQSVLHRFAQRTLKRKVPLVIIISIIALSAFVMVYNTPTGEEFLKLIPNFQSNQGLTVLGNEFGSGVTSPTTIIVTTPTPIIYGDNQFNQTLLDQIDQITSTASNSIGVSSVSSITRPYGNTFNYSGIETVSLIIQQQYEGQMFSSIGSNNKTAVITVGLVDSGDSAAAIKSLQGVEKNVSNLSLMNGISVYYGGETQSTIDSQNFMASLLPEVVIILAVAVYVILFLQLRSAFTPIRLIITILCSVVFSLAITSAIFYYALNLPILSFAPLFVVVTMLGVGIDYDIFFITRVREEVLSGKSDGDAIVTAIDKVWVTILGLGLVLATVFASLIITNIAILQEISLAVASAILIDVTVVILFFVPSLMGLVQKFNWWPYKLSKTRAEDKTNET